MQLWRKTSNWESSEPVSAAAGIDKEAPTYEIQLPDVSHNCKSSENIQAQLTAAPVQAQKGGFWCKMIIFNFGDLGGLMIIGRGYNFKLKPATTTTCFQSQTQSAKLW